MMMIINLLFAANALCAVKVDPQTTFWPLRSAQVRATVEPSSEWRMATLSLYNGSGELVRTSQVWDQTGGILAPKTTQVEWKSLPPAEPGTFTVVLIVTTSREGHGCRAEGRIQVVGGEGSR